MEQISTETTNQAPNRYLQYLIDSSFQGINRPIVLSMMVMEEVTKILSSKCGNKRL